MNKRRALVFTLLILLLIVSVAANMFMGSTGLRPSRDILYKIRLPRALGSVILGGALALAGYLLQTFFHNPIAGPFVLGVSSGAKLTVAIAMTVGAEYGALSSGGLIAAAFVGSMLSLGLVLALSHRVGQVSLLVVCGVMIGYICSAATDFIVTFADDADIVNLRGWSLGSFSGMSMADVRAALLVVIPGLVFSFLLSKPLGAYRLGEAYAVSLGVRVKLMRAEMILLSGVLAAAVTAFAGPISFLGIAAAHIVRVLLRSSEPTLLIPGCFLGGGVFCSLCDLIARTAFSPTELSISTVTAVFGAPVVIAAMLKRRRGAYERAY